MICSVALRVKYITVNLNYSKRVQILEYSETKILFHKQVIINFKQYLG